MIYDLVNNSLITLPTTSTFVLYHKINIMLKNGTFKNIEKGSRLHKCRTEISLESETLYRYFSSTFIYEENED